MVERGPSDQVILHPAHPYTQLLASAAPDPTVTRARLAEARAERAQQRDTRAAERRETRSDTGCRFRGRCPFAMDICAQRPPDLPVVDLEKRGDETGSAVHVARCWLLDESAAAKGTASSL